MNDQPVIDTNKNIAEFTWRVFVLSILLTVLLATANAYLALKLGILTSASIPAAMLSMGILRFFKQATILENNLVQTAASAGEAVAGGIVYTIPALIVIQYWHGFDYWTNFCVAALGGVLGVLFSIPLRRHLVHDPKLKFPEGRAIAEVLKTANAGYDVRNILWGGLAGGLIELLQTGFKIIASAWQVFFIVKRTLIGFGVGFSAAMIGAGFLIGPVMAVSIMLGAVLSWFFAVPVASHVFSDVLDNDQAQAALNMLWNSKMRYFGIGAMLFAGLWTLMGLVKPLVQSISASFMRQSYGILNGSRVERDMPWFLLFPLMAIFCILLLCFFQWIFPLHDLGLAGQHQVFLVLLSVFYVIAIGFLFSVMTGYFSGLVGVTASPGSSIVIAGLLFAAWMLLSFVTHLVPLPLSGLQKKALEAIAIIIGAVVTGIAAIANDNTQDLKVGQLVGATPWKQQVMLLLGVLVSALVIPPVMQILFDVYGIGGVMPRAGMNVSQSLPAPAASMMAAVTEAVFSHTMPWTILLTGALTLGLVLLIWRIFFYLLFRLSILGVAIGMYLPLSTSVPIFIGGMVAWYAKRCMQKTPVQDQVVQRGVLIACGLVAGAAIMDVLLAIPFSIFRTPDVIALAGTNFTPFAIVLAFISTGLLARWMTR